MAPSRTVFNAAIEFAKDSDKESGSLNKAIQAHLKKEAGMDSAATSKIAPWIMYLADKPTATFLKTNKKTLDGIDRSRTENEVVKMIVEALPKPAAKGLEPETSESTQTSTKTVSKTPKPVDEESDGETEDSSDFTTNTVGEKVRREADPELKAFTLKLNAYCLKQGWSLKGDERTKAYKAQARKLFAQSKKMDKAKKQQAALDAKYPGLDGLLAAIKIAE